MIPKDLELGRPIKSNHRFESYEAKLDGKKVFAKHATTSRSKVHLDFQARNAKIVDLIGRDLIRSPKTLLKTKDWLVTEWIDGQPFETQVTTRSAAAAKVLAQIIYVFDSQATSDAVLRDIFKPSGLRQRVNERIPAQVQKKKLFNDVLNLYEKYSTKLEPCLQDADIQPEHLYIDSKKQSWFVLIDSEHLNDHWPRYFDLANNYTKYWKRGNHKFAADLLKSYMDISKNKSDDIFEPFVASVIVRCLALHWEYDHDPGADRHNIPRAQKMLQTCLKAKTLNDLL